MRKTQPPTMEEMDTALHLTLDRAEAAEAELARVQAKLDALMMAFNKNGSLGMLQLIAHDSIARSSPKPGSMTRRHLHLMGCSCRSRRSGCSPPARRAWLRRRSSLTPPTIPYSFNQHHDLSFRGVAEKRRRHREGR